MDFTFLVQNIITKYMTNLDEKGYEEPRKFVFDGLCHHGSAGTCA